MIAKHDLTQIGLICISFSSWFLQNDKTFVHTVEQLDILLIRKLHHIVQLLNVYYHHGSEG